MDTTISRRVAAQPEVMFALAVRVEDWPRLLPHYRRVRILEDSGDLRRVVAMAARRKVAGRFGIPIHWTAIQRFDAERRTIAFEHIRGITTGMRATWSIVVDPSDRNFSIVSIRHVFSPAWPVPVRLVRLIVGDYFVDAIAGRTLRILGQVAELEQQRSTPASTG